MDPARELMFQLESCMKVWIGPEGCEYVVGE